MDLTRGNNSSKGAKVEKVRFLPPPPPIYKHVIKLSFFSLLILHIRLGAKISTISTCTNNSRSYGHQNLYLSSTKFKKSLPNRPGRLS